MQKGLFMGELLQPIHLIVFAVVVVVLIPMALRFSGRGAGTLLSVQTPALVLLKLNVSQDAADHVQLEIVGRPSGILAVLMSIFRVHPESRLLVTKTGVSFSTTSLRGIRMLEFPLRRIQGTECGFSRSVLALVLTVLLGIFTALGLLGLLIDGTRGSKGSEVVALFVAGLVCTAIMALVYHFSKRFWIGISSGTPILKVQFKRGALNNIMVDLPKVAEITAQINKSVFDAAGAYANPASGAGAATASQVRHCRHCAAALDPGAGFCESCGAKITE
jgi:hypothetical protein